MIGACKYCESRDCDEDCYRCADMYGWRRPTAAELRSAGADAARAERTMASVLERKLWLVVIKDKELAGEPDVGVGIIDGTESEARSAGARMMQAMAERGRGRCVARATEIETWRFYRATMWLRTPCDAGVSSVVGSVTCADLDLFFDAEMAAARADAFRDHLGTCERCNRKLLGRMMERMVASGAND